VAKGRSLLVATPPLILPRVKHGAGLLRRTAKYASGRLTKSSAWQESLLIRRDATLRISGALHLTIFEQPEKDDFFSSLIVHYFSNYDFAENREIVEDIL